MHIYKFTMSETGEIQTALGHNLPFPQFKVTFPDCDTIESIQQWTASCFLNTGILWRVYSHIEGRWIFEVGKTMKTIHKVAYFTTIYLGGISQNQGSEYLRLLLLPVYKHATWCKWVLQDFWESVAISTDLNTSGAADSRRRSERSRWSSKTGYRAAFLIALVLE